MGLRIRTPSLTCIHLSKILCRQSQLPYKQTSESVLGSSKDACFSQELTDVKRLNNKQLLREKQQSTEILSNI
jgi:hypothetical protein